jgi:hypothetical protein
MPQQAITTAHAAFLVGCSNLLLSFLSFLSFPDWSTFILLTILELTRKCPFVTNK